MSEFNATTTQHAIQAIQNAAAERERVLREDNERLRGKCNRLVGLIRCLSTYLPAPQSFRWNRCIDSAGIHDGDLTTEPHGANRWHSGNAVSNAEIATVDVTAYARQESE